MKRLLPCLVIAALAAGVFAQTKAMYEMFIGERLVGRITSVVRTAQFEGKPCVYFYSLTDSSSPCEVAPTEYESWVAPDGRPILTIMRIGSGHSKIEIQTRVEGDRVTTLRSEPRGVKMLNTTLTAEESRAIRGTLDGLLDSGIPKQAEQRSLVIDPLTGTPRQSIRTVLGPRKIDYLGQEVETTAVEAVVQDGKVRRSMMLFFDATGRLLRADGDGRVVLRRLPDSALSAFEGDRR